MHSPRVLPRPLQRALTDFFPRLIGHRHVTGTGNGTVMAGSDSCGVILWSWEGPAPLIHISEQKPLQVGY